VPGLTSSLYRLFARAAGEWMSRATLAQIRSGMGLNDGRLSLPAGVRRESVNVGGVPAESFTPAGAAESPALLYFHGGGWVLGLYAGHRLWCAHLSAALGRRVLALDYRLAPEFPFPAGLEDCAAAYRALLRDGHAPERLAIGGDSAGGNFTLALLQRLRDASEPLPAAAVCISAASDLTPESQARHRTDDPMLSSKTGRMFFELYVGDRDPADPRFSPLLGDLRGLPPLLVQTGGAEIILSDSLRLAERAYAAGVNVTLEVYAGMWHGWQIFGAFGLPEGRRATQRVARFVGRHVETRSNDGL
jgi:acetyl esterase/lipase